MLNLLSSYNVNVIMLMLINTVAYTTTKGYQDFYTHKKLYYIKRNLYYIELCFPLMLVKQ